MRASRSLLILHLSPQRLLSALDVSSRLLDAMTTFVCRQCLARPFKAATAPWPSSLSRSLGTRAVPRASLRHSEFSTPRHRPPFSAAFLIPARGFQHLAQQPQKEDPTTARPGEPPQPSGPPTPSKTQASTKQDLGGDAIHISQSEQRKRDWNIVKKLAENLWPKDDWKMRGRVVFGLGLLVGGKVRSFFNLEWGVCMKRSRFRAALERPSAFAFQASD